MTNKETNDISYRDLYVSPDKIYPRQVNGHFARLRILTVLLLLGCYYVTPWLLWNGDQAVLFDLPARQFRYFGVTFWPQDFIYLTLLLIIAAVGLFLFTTIAGRLWCGYACPQTVWTETFLWIEEFVEGNRNKRIKMDKGPWNFNKLTRKSTKHFLWVSYALFTGYTFVGYFSPIRELGLNLLQFNLGPWEWFWVLFYSLATYGNAGWLREQVCLHMCPYARFQSSMFDKDTLIISYDDNRGESRGKRKKNSDYQLKGLGDCIDCNQCVHVCPTGIDIRDGLQYECIACAACIDVCDNVMEKMGYDKGLIKYTTEVEEKTLGNEKTLFFRPRTIIYTSIFLVVVVAFFYLISNRIPLDINVLRDRNNLYTESFSGEIENTYTVKILNMSQKKQTYVLRVEGFNTIKLEGESEFEIESGEILMLPVRIKIPGEQLTRRSNDIQFTIQASGEEAYKAASAAKFLGPKKK
ncbi:MAG: cytochrome c oxidase accessory protein CcoG [Kangiellaceae bacterium]|nr:cytochrome c oxidase accessory protein CcoG [Kangiellaceae bacterium]